MKLIPMPNKETARCGFCGETKKSGVTVEMQEKHVLMCVDCIAKFMARVSELLLGLDVVVRQPEMKE